MTGWIVLLTLAACFVGVAFYVVAPADAELLLERLLDEAYARSPRGRRARVEARRELQRRVLPRLTLVGEEYLDPRYEITRRRVFDQETSGDSGDAA